MRQCDGCTLCCKIAPVPTLAKRANQWCAFCVSGGCSIQETKPKACKDFTCWWLADGMSEAMRPDRAHLYVSGAAGDDVLKIMVDPLFPDAWQSGAGRDIVNLFSNHGFHLLVVIGRSVTFLVGKGRTEPEKILLDWQL